MGVYYYIVNRTKKEIVHYDYHVKHSLIVKNNNALAALFNYLINHIHDDVRLISDESIPDEYFNYYKEVDLIKENVNE